MKKLLRISLILLLTSLILPNNPFIYAEPETKPESKSESKSESTKKTGNLDDLLKQVLQQNRQLDKENKQREKEFLIQKDQQKAKLQAVKTQLAKLEQQRDSLKNQFENNEKSLERAEEKLRLTMGTIGEIFGVIRQVAGDTRAQFTDSIISTQFPDRMKFIANLAEKKEISNIEEITRLWYEIQREMTESGKTVKYPATIIGKDGAEQEKTITRVGPFNIILNGKYLKFLPQTQQLVEYSRQPPGRYLDMASDLESTKADYSPFAIDPTRGSILALLVQAPSLMERIRQGGVIGYIILIILAFGLLMAIERLVYLFRVEKKINTQLKSESPIQDNPLGNVLAVYFENKKSDLEKLELKLNEAILKNIPQLEKRTKTIKILAAISPLLGLLGTVTGMIATFQSITLFGTGDPKLMAGGISQALVTTVLGLISAIPLLLSHNIITNKSNRLVQIIEEQSAGMVATHWEKEKVN